MFGFGFPHMMLLPLIVIVPGVFYLLTLHKTLSLCSRDSRSMEPGLVWLLLIPFFNMIWHFFVVTAISKSLHREFVKRNIGADPTPGRGVGLAMCVLFAATIIPHLAVAATLVAIICWIVYWVKIAGYSAALRRAPTEGNGQPSAPPDRQ